jgi:hypothetical protein
LVVVLVVVVVVLVLLLLAVAAVVLLVVAAAAAVVGVPQAARWRPRWRLPSAARRFAARRGGVCLASSASVCSTQRRTCSWPTNTTRGRLH